MSVMADYIFYAHRAILIIITQWITFLPVRGVPRRNYNNYMERLYTTKIVKIGSSAGVVIPKEILAACMLERGDQVSFGVISGPTLIMRQISDQEIRRIKPVHDIRY